jgi:3-methyladenine DNA glycosylase Mpg
MYRERDPRCSRKGFPCGGKETRISDRPRQLEFMNHIPGNGKLHTDRALEISSRYCSCPLSANEHIWLWKLPQMERLIT